MKESLLHDLLGRGADSIDPPDYDVDDLVARMESRLARRRWKAVAAAAVTVVLAGAGAVALSLDREPPTPAPSGPVEREQGLGTRRPLVYADGENIHFGDRTFDAGADVVFVEATEEGAVFITEDDYRPGGRPQAAPLWFTDGSDVVQLGVTLVRHVYDFRIATANPGSLVAWLGVESGRSPTLPADLAVWVYDTREGKVVARVPETGVPGLDTIEHIVVNGDRVYWEHGASAEVVRYDVSTGIAEDVSWRSYHANLARNPRTLAFGNASDQYGPPPVVAQRLAAFMQVGDRLVPTDSIHWGNAGTDIPTTLLDGRPLQLRVPKGYDAETTSFTVVQWLDDGRLVLFAYHEHSELPMHVGDILVCPVPSGTCEVVVPASDATPYVPPGEVY